MKEHRRRWVRCRPFVFAAAGGVLCFLGFVGFGIWPLMLVGLVPFWEALEETRERRWRATGLAGLVFGWVAYAGGYHWMWHIIDVFLGGRVLLGVLLWLADSAWFTLRFVVCAVLYRLVRQRGWPVAVAAVPSFVFVEWLYPLLFPVHFGDALVRQTVLIQISDLGGPLLRTTLVAVVNLVVLESWRWWRAERTRPVWTWGLVGVAVLLVWGYGTMRMPRIDAAVALAPALRVGLVQGNLGVLEKGNVAAADHRRYLEQTRELLAAGGVDLVVWPETVYTRGLRRPLPVSGQLIEGDLQVPLLFGAATIRTDSGQRLAYNSALLIGADGVIRDAYDKNLLIPLTEYIPFASLAAPFVERFASPSHFAAADAVPPLRLGPWRISTPICYEVLRPAFVRRMVVEAQPQLIVTLANDSWFGDSQEPRMHLALATFRAVEHRRYLVRATNSGISAVVDPVGREVARSGVLTRQNVRATVHLLDVSTVYTRWGDWPGWLAAALVLITVVPLRRRLVSPGESS